MSADQASAYLASKKGGTPLKPGEKYSNFYLDSEYIPNVETGKAGVATTKTDSRGVTTGSYGGKDVTTLNRAGYKDLATNKKALEKFVEDGVIYQSKSGEGTNIDNPTKTPQEYISILNGQGVTKDRYDIIANEDIQFKAGKEPIIRTQDGQLVKIVKYVSRGTGSDRHGSTIGVNLATNELYTTGRGSGADYAAFIKPWQEKNK
jgi:hypothetical protein